MSNKEPKVTECWMGNDCDGCPDVFDDLAVSSTDAPGYSPAIVLWRDDYDAMRKELEELRAESAKWKPFEHGHYKQEGEIVHFVCSAEAPRLTHTGEIMEAHDDEVDH